MTNTESWLTCYLQRLYRIESDKVITQVDELELEKGEDAPMSMAAHAESKAIVCGINSSEEALKDSSNQNCRRFTVEDGKYVPAFQLPHHRYQCLKSGYHTKQVRAHSSLALRKTTSRYASGYGV